MILGVGTDMVDRRRLHTLYTRFGVRLLQRVFTVGEQAYAARHARAGEDAVWNRYATTFAAKEACAKALGSGIGRHGIRFVDIEVVRDAQGKPHIHLHGTARAYARQWVSANSTLQWQVSLSDEPPYALAFVIAQSVPAP